MGTAQGALVIVPPGRVRLAPRPARVRWDRLVVFAAVAIIAVATLLGLGTRAPADASGLAQAVVVQAGDTVWDLALAHLPAGEDRMSYVVRVLAANNVEAGNLQPGTVLLLPP